MEGLILLIVFFGVAFIGFLAWVIAEIVCFVQNRKWKKWCNFVFATYPELKVLLAEWSRLRKEHCETVKDALQLQKDIDEWTEKNKYLPHGHRVDGHIEALKEQYQELLEIRAEQSELADKAKEEIDKFWETNFPNLREDKRIMWWEN
jgi:hypothetical protein